MQTTSQKIAEVLYKKGITHFFTVCGGGTMKIHKALLDVGITCVEMLHEQSCVVAAEAYFKASGRMAGALVTSGPGVTNAITGVVGALGDKVPMIIISGKIRDNDDFLDYSINVADILPHTPFLSFYTITGEDDTEVHTINYLAMETRMRMYWIDVLVAAQDKEIELSSLIEIKPFRYKSQCLRNETYPNYLPANTLFILGHEAEREKEKVQSKLMELGRPALLAFDGVNALPASHSCFVGASGRFGTLSQLEIIKRADKIINVGNVALDTRHTGFGKCKKLMKASTVNIDYFLQLEGYEDSFLKECKEIQEQYIPKILPSEKDIKDFKYLFEPGVPIVCSPATVSLVLYRYFSGEATLFWNWSQTALGWELPAAIGVYYATGNPVEVAAGDGSIMFNIQELQTIIRHALPISVRVLCNGGYATIRDSQERMFHEIWNPPYHNTLLDIIGSKIPLTFFDSEEIIKPLDMEIL